MTAGECSVPVAGGQQFDRAAGTPGPPAIVTVHSGLAHSRMWSPLMTALRDGAFVIANEPRLFVDGRQPAAIERELRNWLPTLPPPVR